MDQKRVLSKEVYGIEEGKVKPDTRLKDTDYIVLDTIDTNKDTLKIDEAPRKNSMQAMAVAEIKDEYKTWDDSDLKDIKGYPESVVKKDLTILYAGTTSKRDWQTNVGEIFLEAKTPEGAFDTSVEYAREIERKYPKQDGFIIGTSGHSLGGAEAIYVAVLKGYNARLHMVLLVQV